MAKIMNRKPAVKTTHRPAAANRPAKKTHKKAAVKVEFPQENEVVARPSYTVRIAAPLELERVEMSVNGAEWVPCREAMGLWWYDWSNFEPGLHRLVARVVDENGEILEEVERQVVVV